MSEKEGSAMRSLNANPKADGFRMPGEFEKHAGTYMIWPERKDNWRNSAKDAQKVFAEVAKEIGKFEKVTMLVGSTQYDNARHILPEYVRVIEMSSDDSWVRDCGPTFVVNGRGDVRAVDWTFNAWGGLVDGLYFPWDKDDSIAAKLCEVEQIDRYRTEGFILEGGSICVDGDGTAIVTKECLLSKGRNPHLNQHEIEKILEKFLNVDKVLWLPYGIFNDETNGHVDNICSFVEPGVIVHAWTSDKQDPQYEMVKANLDYLETQMDAKKRKIVVHKLPLPLPTYITEEESEGIVQMAGTKLRQTGDRMAGSYVNYYICNGAIIMPGFNDPNDLPAKKKLEEIYPDRKVIQIYTREILLGGGNIHCITQQLPAYS